MEVSYETQGLFRITALPVRINLIRRLSAIVKVLSVFPNSLLNPEKIVAPSNIPVESLINAL
jgi:hypothetical protein